MRIHTLVLVFALSAAFLFAAGGNQKSVFALPEIAEWKTGDFTIEIKDWDNPLGVEGVDNSGLKQDTCTYQVESFNQATGAWEITRATTQRTCAIPIPITVGPKTGEGYKGTTDIQVQTADCKYSGENSCRITAWAQDYAGNNSLGTEYMLTRIYSIDFGPPQAKITGISSPDPGTQRGHKNGGVFLRGKDDGTNRTYTITVEFRDEGSVGLNACHFALYKGGNGTPFRAVRTESVACSGSSAMKSFNFTAGPTGECDIQDDNNCTVWVWGVDNAGYNEGDTSVRWPPSESQEKAYLDLSADFTERVNFLPVGVDYTAPHAQ